MVPWKIIYSAASLLAFMAALAIFLAPIAAILAADYWVVKKKHIDIPSLYRRHGRYRYQAGINWRAAVAFLVSVAPNLPGMARSVNPNLNVGTGGYIYNFNYLWGFSVAFILYSGFSYVWPATETLIAETIHGDTQVVDGKEVYNDGLETPIELVDGKAGLQTSVFRRANTYDA
jgi:NCS1 family nucleobase:cation symporter-1